MPFSRRLRTEARTEDGVSLIELLISMTVLSVALVVFMAALFSIQGAVARASDRSIANDQARLAVRQIDREIRSGNVFETPASGGMSLIIYTQANATTRPTGHRCVEWAVEDEELRSRSWRADWADHPGDPLAITAWRNIADNIVNVSENVPLFELDTSAEYGGRVMKVRVAANASGGRDRAVEISLVVNGRNTRFGGTPTPCDDIPPE